MTRHCFSMPLRKKGKPAETWFLPVSEYSLTFGVHFSLFVGLFLLLLKERSVGYGSDGLFLDSEGRNLRKFLL